MGGKKGNVVVVNAMYGECALPGSRYAPLSDTKY